MQDRWFLLRVLLFLRPECFEISQNQEGCQVSLLEKASFYRKISQLSDFFGNRPKNRLEFLGMSQISKKSPVSTKDVRIRIDSELSAALDEIIADRGLRSPREAVGLLIECYKLLSFQGQNVRKIDLFQALTQLQICILTLAETVDGLTEFMASEHQSRIAAAMAQVEQAKELLNHQTSQNHV